VATSASALQSNDGAALLCAVLAGGCDEEEAGTILAIAADIGVDPIDFCALRLAIAPETAMARAAEWAGLDFATAVPLPLPGSARLRRIDELAGVRSLRVTDSAGEITYLAPEFRHFVQFRARGAGPRRLCVVPPAAIRTALAAASRDDLLDAARHRLARRWPHASAHRDLTLAARLLFLAVLLLLTLLIALAPFVFGPLALLLAGPVVLVPAVFRLAAALLPADAAPEPEPPPLPEAALPVYSVLIPLRDEAEMVPLLYRAMAALDYPPERLDFKFVVEERSEATVAAVAELPPDPRFALVLVPEASPGTKPKALNYALPLVRGDLLVVYDAEDIPDRDQLRRAAALMADDPGLDCLQAELVVDNAAENPLTALFSGEYAGQFGLVLPLLARLHLPMPLGGTSNHFRTRSLRELGGWDAFNVTEDADLGVRLARLRYRTGVLASQTHEEAPVSLAAWMNQRTRWMKGWMQTLIVHNRSPRRLLGDIGWKGFVAFELYVGAMMLSAPLHTVFMAALVLQLAGGGLAITGGWDGVALAVLGVGYGGAFLLAVTGLLRLGQGRLVGWQLLLPLYWLLHSVAALRAGHDLLARPYFWSKTTHGRTRMRRTLKAAGPDRLTG